MWIMHMGIELSYQIRKLYTYDNLNVYMHIMCLPLFTETKHNYIVNYYELVYILCHLEKHCIIL